jgi:hypothetical protein
MFPQSNIQMQKTGARCSWQGNEELPASDLERYAEIK